MHGEVSFSVQIVAVRYHPQSGWLDEGPQRGSTQLSHGDLFSSDHGGSLKGGFYSIAVHGSTNTRKTPASSKRPLDGSAPVALASTHPLRHRQRGSVRHLGLCLSQHLAIQRQIALYV